MMSRFAGPLVCGLALFAATAAMPIAPPWINFTETASIVTSRVTSSRRIRLSAAALSGSKDPRVYYYRGLACLRLGEPDAMLDFNRGASSKRARTIASTTSAEPWSESKGRSGCCSSVRDRSRPARTARYSTAPLRRHERICAAEPDVLMKPAPASAAKNRPSPAAPPVVANDDPFSENVPEAAGAAAADEVAADGPAEEMATEESDADAMPGDEPAADEPAAECPRKSAGEASR